MKKFILGMMSVAMFNGAFAMDTDNIENEIEKIQSLPQQERVEKMNELKVEISHLNEHEREKLINHIAEKHNIEHTSHNKEKENQSILIKNNHTKIEHISNDIEHDITEIDHETTDIEHVTTSETSHETTNIEHDTTTETSHENSDDKDK